MVVVLVSVTASSTSFSGAVIEVAAVDGHALEEHFFAAHGHALGKRAREKDAHQAGAGDDAVEHGDDHLEPAVGHAEADVHAEDEDGEQAQVEVDLEPGGGAEQREERDLLAEVVRREDQHDAEEDPAGDKRRLGQPLRVGPEVNRQQRRGEQREEQGESAAFDESLHGESVHIWLTTKARRHGE